jgi:hypothetical protein
MISECQISLRYASGIVRSSIPIRFTFGTGSHFPRRPDISWTPGIIQPSSSSVLRFWYWELLIIPRRYASGTSHYPTSLRFGDSSTIKFQCASLLELGFH